MMWPICVQAISPGFVRTEFHGRMKGMEDMEQAKKDYGPGVSCYNIA